MVFKKIIMSHSIVVPNYLTLLSALYFSMYLNILFYYYVLLPLLLTIVMYYCGGGRVLPPRGPPGNFF